MSGNIIVFLIALVLGIVAFKFGLSSEKQSIATKQWLVLFIWLQSLFLILNTYFAFNGWRGLRVLTSLPPVESSGDWQRSNPGEEIVLVGTVSADNQVLRGEDIVAYFECGKPCYVYISLPLSIDLTGTSVAIGNRDFQEREWIYERGLTYSYYNLGANDPVVIFGLHLENHIQAEVIFRGEYDQFLAYTQQKISQARLLMGLNAIGSASFIGAGFAYWESENSPLKRLFLKNKE